MRVLVTRPEPSAGRTAAELVRRGHEPVVLPVMQATHDVEALRTALEDEPSALVATSMEALRALSEAGYRHSVLFLPLFAVGHATAEAARKMGFTEITTGSGDGESLAERILADEETLRDRELLYLAGVPRSQALETKLQQAGMKLGVVECYRMSAIQHPAASVESAFEPIPEVILIYSAETARHFLALPAVSTPPERFQHARFLCLSEKIADTLPPTLRTRAAWPAEPREDLLLDLI